MSEVVFHCLEHGFSRDWINHSDVFILLSHDASIRFIMEEIKMVSFSFLISCLVNYIVYSAIIYVSDRKAQWWLIVNDRGKNSHRDYIKLSY